MNLLSAMTGPLVSPLLHKRFDPLGSTLRHYYSGHLSTVTEIANKVTQWNDIGYAEDHATQTVDAERPVTGSVTQNGHNGITFTRANLNNLITTQSTRSNYTIYVVAKKNSSELLMHPRGIYVTLKFGATGQVLNFTSSYSETVWLRVGTTTASVTSGSDAPIGTTVIATGVVGESLSTNSSRVFVNNDAGSIVNNTFSGYSVNEFIGASVNNASADTNHFDGTIFALLEYDGTHGAGERKAVWDMLNDIYAVF